MPRVISLIASATEMVAALGLEDQLVGRSHECDYPATVRKLPICTEPNFQTTGSSQEIDTNVKNQLKHGLSIYKVHTEVINNLNPDVLITQSHCDVCAVSQKDIAKALLDEGKVNPRIVSLAPNRLEDVWNGFADIAKELGVSTQGNDVIGRIQNQMKSIEEKAATAEHRPTVACIEWMDPLMAAGNWVPELVRMAGGDNLFGVEGKHSPWMTWEDIKKKNPDIILVLPCGFDIERTRQETDVLKNLSGWLDLNAVINNRVFLLDGNQYFNRPGPRLLDSLEIMAEVIHPELFDFGHKMTGWQYI